MDLIYRLAVLEDLHEIMALMERTASAITDKNLFVADDRDFVRRHLDSEGEILLAIARENDDKSRKDILAGFLILRKPMDSADNLGRDIGLKDRELLKVVHMESVAVSPCLRGRKIMQKLIQQGESRAAGQGFIYAMCTVSPDNPWSLSNMLACGYEIIKTCPKYGGRLRHILMRRLPGAGNANGEGRKL